MREKNTSSSFSSLFFSSAILLSDVFLLFFKDTPRVSDRRKEFTLPPNVGKHCTGNTFMHVDALVSLGYYFYIN